MTREDSERLLLRARSGDRKAFEELCKACSDSLAAWIRSHLGRGARTKVEPEDILQETLLRAFERIGIFRGKDERAFFNWLASISEHLIWNVTQKRSPQYSSLVFEPQDTGISPSGNLRRKERLERLKASLATLKPDQRTALLLSKIDGLSVKQIARRMDRSDAAVKQLLSRGLKELRHRFGDTASLHLPDAALDGGESDGRE